MEIAPGIHADVWHGLDLQSPTSGGWRKAVSILRARIEDRYLIPADRLVNAEKNKSAHRRRYGFAVLALDCLLVETLGAFVEGRTDTERKSRKVFSAFLRTREPFAAHFAAPGVAERFYDEFRCGILHQAEIKGRSLVWSVGPLLEIHGNAMTINRNRFHTSLRQAFSNYLAELRDPANTELRRHFTNKMDFIARKPGT